MALPSPNLDDRRFQQLVDDAKRLVQQHCPEWTDHNVSDPGVTIIEAFASIADQLIYRLNQVPDGIFMKFLELLGVRLSPPVAARTDITFWLSGDRPEPVRVPRGTVVATMRTETEPPVSFTVTEDLDIVPCRLSNLLSTIEPGRHRNHTEALGFAQEILCFDQVPKPGDALLLGLSEAVPSCAVTLRFDCSIGEGHGVDPRNPPLAWEALGGEQWLPCEVERDETGGLNRPGDVILHVPAAHVSTTIEDLRAGWIRCRVVDETEGQPAYGGSPEIRGVRAFTVGGTVPVVNAEIIENEVVGFSTGVPGQRFPLKFRPVVPDGELVLDILDPTTGEREEWSQVQSFLESGRDDRHFMVEAMDGQVLFGPAVREQDGTLTHHGAVPPSEAPIRIRSYRVGGGTAGNVAAGTIKMLKGSVPYVARLENRKPATGGLDGEDVQNAKVRGPMQLRGTRAVAARDFEHQAILAAPNEVARVLCLPAGDGSEPGAVRVVITPAAEGDELGRLQFEQLTPLDERLLGKVTEHLDRRRVVGVRCVVEPPLYMGLTVEARLAATPRADTKRLEDEALRALYHYFHPISGGPHGRGWPFGRPVHSGEAFWVLQRLTGVRFVEDARLYPSNPITGQRGDPVERLELEPNALVFSHEHTIEVVTEGS